MSECLICGKLFTPKKPTGQPCCSGKCLKALKRSWAKHDRKGCIEKVGA